jgi:hypothetical protein
MPRDVWCENQEKKKLLGRPWRRFEEVIIMDHEEIGGYRLKSPVLEQIPVAGLL